MWAKTSEAPLEAAAALEPGVPELIVDPPLLVVGEDLVGLVAGLELRLGRVVARVAVGVMLQRFALVRLANVVGARSALDAQDFVVIALFRHTTWSVHLPTRRPTVGSRAATAAAR